MQFCEVFSDNECEQSESGYQLKFWECQNEVQLTATTQNYQLILTFQLYFANLSCFRTKPPGGEEGKLIPERVWCRAFYENFSPMLRVIE